MWALVAQVVKWLVLLGSLSFSPQNPSQNDSSWQDSSVGKPDTHGKWFQTTAAGHPRTLSCPLPRPPTAEKS